MNNTPLNFANGLQTAVGLEISAEQFLSAEKASGLAFSIAAQEAGDLALAAEFGLRVGATSALNAVGFENAVRWFLQKIWRDCDGREIGWDFVSRRYAGDDEKLTTARLCIENDADGAMVVLTHTFGVEAQIIGKAADAIEARFGCRWGRDGGDVGGLVAHIS